MPSLFAAAGSAIELDGARIYSGHSSNDQSRTTVTTTQLWNTAPNRRGERALKQPNPISQAPQSGSKCNDLNHGMTACDIQNSCIDSVEKKQEI
jgi:hypothetical protein